VEGIEQVPSSDAAKHMGAAMASYGSTPLFHLVGVTPECDSLADVGAEHLSVEKITQSDIDELRGTFGATGEKVDVVVFAAPQLSLVEMQSVAELCRGRKLHPETDMLVCTPASVYVDAQQAGFIADIENFGARVLQGTCFYQQYAREIGEANNWTRLLSNSTKIVNILGGYGYKPALASMAACIDSAVAGEIV
jgi:predicted aconitase